MRECALQKFDQQLVREYYFPNGVVRAQTEYFGNVYNHSVMRSFMMNKYVFVYNCAPDNNVKRLFRCFYILLYFLSVPSSVYVRELFFVHFISHQQMLRGVQNKYVVAHWALEGKSMLTLSCGRGPKHAHPISDFMVRVLMHLCACVCMQAFFQYAFVCVRVYTQVYEYAC